MSLLTLFHQPLPPPLKIYRWRISQKNCYSMHIENFESNLFLCHLITKRAFFFQTKQLEWSIAQGNFCHLTATTRYVEQSYFVVVLKMVLHLLLSLLLLSPRCKKGRKFSGFIKENDFGKFGMNQRSKAMKTKCRARLKGINVHIILIAVSSSGDELVSFNVK